MAISKKKNQYLKYIKPTLKILSDDNALISEKMSLHETFQETVKLIHNLSSGPLKKILDERLLEYFQMDNGF